MGIKLTVVDENSLDKITDFNLDVNDMEFDSDWYAPQENKVPANKQQPANTSVSSNYTGGMPEKNSFVNMKTGASVQEPLIYDASDMIDLIDLDEWLPKEAEESVQEESVEDFYTPNIPDTAFEPIKQTESFTSSNNSNLEIYNPFLEQLKKQDNKPQQPNQKSHVQVFSSLEKDVQETGSLLRPVREKPFLSEDITVYNQRDLREDSSIYIGTEIEAAVEFEGKVYKWVEQVCGWFSRF
jgi:hypothetical protein